MMHSLFSLTTSLLMTACTCLDVAPTPATIGVSSDFVVEAMARSNHSASKPTVIVALMLFGSVVLLSQHDNDEESC
jgi:hypothetical protein